MIEKCPECGARLFPNRRNNDLMQCEQCHYQNNKNNEGKK